VSDYDLLPDDVNYSYAQQRAVFKKPLTTIEVFKELIAQRLSQVGNYKINPNKGIMAKCDLGFPNDCSSVV
jgi:DEP domain-containing protein 5